VKTPVAVVGAILGAAPIIVLGFIPDFRWLTIGIAAGSMLLWYIIAALTATSDFGEFMRGLLIGVNTGLNVALANVIFGQVFRPEVGLIIAGVVGVINFLAVIGPVSNSEVYQGFLGWANWLMPMSWLVVGLGLLFYILNLIGGLLHLIGKVEFCRIQSMAVDWKTGTFFTHGGWISNLNPIDTAFNMGAFSFVDNASSDMHIEHEAGHTLNLGAFGSVFHFIGAIDENVTGGGRNAYSERLAESNDPSTSQSNIIPMWV
jgi:MFS family permease